MQEKIDKLDSVILEALQSDARIGLEALADLTGLSVPSVQRRVKSLRDRGVIMRDVSLLDPAKVAVPMTFIVMVELERERLDQLDAFVQRVQRDPHVQQCYYVTGEADFCLICTAASMGDFEALTKRLFYEDSNVRRFRTSVVMGRKKTGLHIPVEPNA